MSCMFCGVGSLLVGYCSLRCAHLEVQKRADRERETIDALAKEIFQLTEALRVRRGWLVMDLRRDGMVLG